MKKTNTTLFLMLMVSAVNLLFAAPIPSVDLENLKLSEKEVPADYKLVEENHCISIQARLFYKQPDMYEMILGKIVKKQIQNFESKNDKGSILYFEFEKKVDVADFLSGLLWGAPGKPTKEHPEQFYNKDKFLVIWSFHKGSALAKLSEDKIRALLK